MAWECYVTKEARRIKLDDLAADLPGHLEEMARDDLPWTVELDGRVIELHASFRGNDQASAGHDPERLRRTLRETAGAFKGLNRDEFLNYIHEQREQKERPTRS
jgi:hypothetical protein